MIEESDVDEEISESEMQLRRSNVLGVSLNVSLNSFTV